MRLKIPVQMIFRPALNNTNRTQVRECCSLGENESALSVGPACRPMRFVLNGEACVSAAPHVSGQMKSVHGRLCSGPFPAHHCSLKLLCFRGLYLLFSLEHFGACVLRL